MHTSLVAARVERHAAGVQGAASLARPTNRSCGGCGGFSSRGAWKSDAGTLCNPDHINCQRVAKNNIDDLDPRKTYEWVGIYYEEAGALRAASDRLTFTMPGLA